MHTSPVFRDGKVRGGAWLQNRRFCAQAFSAGFARLDWGFQATVRPSSELFDSYNDPLSMVVVFRNSGFSFFGDGVFFATMPIGIEVVESAILPAERIKRARK